MIRRVRRGQMDRRFDVEFWQRQGWDAILSAPGQNPGELRIERVVSRVQRENSRGGD